MDIKKIYISGGSQCIGGGFNWPEVKKVYKEVFNLEIENHLDVAYPTIVGKIGIIDISFYFGAISI